MLAHISTFHATIRSPSIARVTFRLLRYIPPAGATILMRSSDEGPITVNGIFAGIRILGRLRRFKPGQQYRLRRACCGYHNGNYPARRCRNGQSAYTASCSCSSYKTRSPGYSSAKTGGTTQEVEISQKKAQKPRDIEKILCFCAFLWPLSMHGTAHC